MGFELQKPKVYKGDENISGWIMSEKLDGIRAYWDGKALYTRQGKELSVPPSFIVNFPPFELDGELWTARGDFEKIQSIVMDKSPSKEWQKISYNIFEVPNATGDFMSRITMARDWFEKHENPRVRIIEQIECKSHLELSHFLDEIVSNGGEGVVVRNPNSPYQSGRSVNVLKVKKFDDMEGRVVAINMSNRTSRVSSLTLKLENGVVFKVGTGFDDRFQKHTLQIGDLVTFKYFGLTMSGKPKFASYMRVRRD